MLPVTAASKDQVPDWVKAAAAQTLPTYPVRTDAVVLLDEHTYTIAADGGKTEHVRRVVKVLRPQGRDYGQLAAEFSNAEKLKSMHLWSIGADGHEYAVRDNEMSDHGVGEGYELYNDDKMRSAAIPALGPGAITAMEFERQGQPYENDIIWIPNERIPVATERLALNLPPGYTYKAAWKDKHSSATPVDLENGRTLWEVKDLPATRLDDVEMAPGWLSLASRLDVFYYGRRRCFRRRPCAATGKTLACGTRRWRRAATRRMPRLRPRRRSWCRERPDSASGWRPLRILCNSRCAMWQWRSGWVDTSRIRRRTAFAREAATARTRPRC